MDAADLLEFDELAAETGAALWPATVTLGGAAVAATVVAPRQGMNLGAFAETPEEVVLTVRIRKAVLATAPAAGEVLGWNGKKWKVRSITGGAHEAQWALACEPAP